MRYFVCKSEPSAYSIADLKRDGVTPWDGVRNYQVRNLIRDDMRVGDRALFYHSSAGVNTGVVGLMEVASSPYPDPTQFDALAEHFDPAAKQLAPRWYCVDMRFVEQFVRMVPLAELKADASLAGMRLIQKGNRLSISRITAAEFNTILAMAKMQL